MKKIILITALLFVGLNSVFADQLAYLSKEDAEKAAELIQGKKVILFCGCCTGDQPIKVKVLKVEVRYTNYKDFYDIYITYKNENGDLTTEPIDLAYTWVKLKKKSQTVGKVLGLKHDPCSEAINWRL